MSCASCGGSLVEGARFCPHCGERVRPEALPTDRLWKLLEAALGTHYRVLREIGRGGMGAVYLAEETGLDRLVAIKVLPPERAESGTHRERFRREARTAARLSHPNVVPLHAFGEREGMLYYVMGYVEGESLAERLRREGRLPESEVRRVLGIVADALQYAHEQGVVHRDVKPHNILLEARSGRPMLTDFGIAKLASEGTALTSTGMLVGTPDYMSPEQAAGRTDVGPSSDVYSLGVVGYAMLAGRLPFEGRTPAEAIAARLTSAATPLPTDGPPATSALAAAVMRCLGRTPEERWPDAGTFARVLARIGDEEEAPPPPEIGRIECAGLGLLALAYASGVAWALGKAAGTPGPELMMIGKIFPPLTAGLTAVLLVVTAAALRRHPLPAVARALFLEPASWTLWYPAALRRPGNVWDRLPADVRRLRLALGLLVQWAIAPLAPLIGLRVTSPANPVFRWAWFLPTLIAAAGITVAAGVWFAWLAWRVPRRLRAKGLTAAEAGRMAQEAPLSQLAFWTRPAVAALLRPATAVSADGSTLLEAASESHIDTKTLHT